MDETEGTNTGTSMQVGIVRCQTRNAEPGVKVETVRVGGVGSGGGCSEGSKALSFLSHLIHHIESPFSTQREMAIKAKMRNYAWLSTIKDG